MIINSTGSTKVTIGDTKEYKTTIDVENIDFIATLLSSNLYSDPESSFIREIVSNGWDAHVEAGNTDIPIVVKIDRAPNDYFNHHITIRDYGTGLSKEDFENIYCKIGTSTKRASNDYLGCFGIGKYATMAVSKVAYITSYHNGIARFYIMTKDGNNITTNLMSENPTTEHNGLEITIRNVSNFNRYTKAIDSLLFFPNVYVDGINSIVNTTKIKRFKYFSYASTIVENKILLGNVLYPLNTSILPPELVNFYRNIVNSGVVINFNIGELIVTPNRESIIYNSKTNALIIDRVKAAFKEMRDIIKSNISLDFDNPCKYHDFFEYKVGFDFITNTVYYRYNSPRFVPTFKASELDFDVTLYGEKNVDMSVLFWIRNNNPCKKAYVANNKVYKDKYPYIVNRDSNSSDAKIIFVNSSLKLSAILKSYLVEYYPNTLLVSHPTFIDFTTQYFNSVHCIDKTDPTMLKTLKSCYDWYLRRGKFIDFDNYKPFLDYKEQLKKEAKENKTPVLKDVILYITLPSGYDTDRHFKTYNDAVKYIKSLHNGVFFRKIDDGIYSRLTSKLGYISIAANQKVLNLLSKESFTSKIDTSTLLHHSDLVFYNTVKNSDYKNYITDNLSVNFINTLPEEFKQLIRRCRAVFKKELYAFDTAIDYNSNVPIDSHLLDKFNQLAACYRQYCVLIDDLDIHGSVDNHIGDLVAYIIMKNKLYRVSNDCYNKIKSNKIILNLCKK